MRGPCALVPLPDGVTFDNLQAALHALSPAPASLLIVADDYGYSERCNDGILDAARAGAIDAASAMINRPDCVAVPLLETGIQIGLHIEEGGPAKELGSFRALFGRDPGHLDGHHHCHAGGSLEREVTEVARLLGIRVRAVDEAHRMRLQRAGVRCAERLIGRIHEDEPVLPAEIASLDQAGGGQGGGLQPGLTEWMVHPGYADSKLGSSYDAAREEDLAELLRLAAAGSLAGVRA